MRFARPVRSKRRGENAIPLAWVSNGTRRLLIFSYGLFSIAAQTLLFREFITTFEGNDISVGIFFASWFLWVGSAALFVYKAQTIAEKLLKNIEFLFLAYLPAFILQLILIIQARELAGIESYTLWSIRAILLLSIVVNAPVSIITGMLFPTACRWVQKGHQELAVSRVYIIEAAGSFVGGLGVTVLLGLGVTLVKVFFILALILSSSVFCALLAKTGQYSKLKIRAQLTFLLPLCILFCLAVGADEALIRYVRIVKWTKLLPADALSGSFQTAQAEYLYGIYNDQWVAIREGSVCEALPDESTAGQIAAISLCQNPDAERVLVIGSGLGLCNELLRLPQIEDVTWAHCDNEYVLEINKFIPPELKISDKRFHPLAGDIRSLLARKKQYYDLVILNLPDATSSVLNRYYTHQFYSQVKETLRPDGALGVRIAGGENIMGTELINLGASTKLTLEKVFSQLVLTPGEDTWFIASDSKNLTGEPGTLRDRFETIEGGTKIFSGTALLSVYLPDRAAAAFENYSGADLPEELLINRDSRPLTHLYSLLLAAKQSGAPVTRLVKHLALAGPLAFLIPILVLVVLRAIYILKTSGQGSPTSFDSTFLVFSAGSVGIGVVIVLMYLYQTRFGSLYLHIGVISSVFMVGLTTGATLISYLIRQNIKPRIRTTNEILLLAVILVHTLVLATIALWPGEQWTHLIFAIAFVLCGLCAGCYFPLAARQLADSGFETGKAGSKLETADHIGASVGGLLTSLALVPLLGTKLTLLVFVLLILANLPLAALRIYKPEKVFSLDITAFSLRRLGYTLFGIGLSVIFCSNLLAAAGDKLRPPLPQYAAQALAGRSHLEPAAAAGQNAGEINYFEVYESPNTPSDDVTKKKLAGYIFSSQDLAPEVRGFGGKMNLAIYVDTTGKLVNFHIIRSNETPAYLKLLNKWRDSLNERKLFRPEPFTDIDAVSGATVSSEAILSALQSSGHRFATQILGHKTADSEKASNFESRTSNFLSDIHGIYLISAFIVALIVIYRGGFWSRLGVLALNLVIGGIVLNAQYSSEQIATILSLHTPAAGLTGAFLLVIGIPLLIIFFGNIYCGYVCPFGAAQELLSYIVPERFKQPVATERLRKARFFKYVVLFVLIIVFFLSRNRTTLAAEPLIEIFNFRFTIYDFQSAIVNWQLSIPLIVTIALTGSVFYVRFWCRYLCPVGAFLSLLSNVAILKRYLPVKRVGKCEFGLSAKDQIDCLCCDRCRYERRKSTQPLMPYPLMKLLSRYFVVVVLAVTIFVSTVSISRFLQVIPASLEYPTSLAAGGQPRDVDLERIRTMIRQQKLSDQEAEFYKKVD
ncbi:MAG: 4Fe-4S binding protein [Planctomycetota bacterium]|jgi:spermidine synthase